MSPINDSKTCILPLRWSLSVSRLATALLAAELLNGSVCTYVHMPIYKTNLLLSQISIKLFIKKGKTGNPPTAAQGMKAPRRAAQPWQQQVCSPGFKFRQILSLTQRRNQVAPSVSRVSKKMVQNRMEVIL